MSLERGGRKEHDIVIIYAVTTLIVCELLAFKAGKRIGPLLIGALLIGALLIGLLLIGHA